MNMSTQMIFRWGILGCGKIAGKFAGDLKHSEGGKLVACASRDYSKAQLFALQHDIPLCFGDYESMLQSDEVDIVYIATPHNMHVAHTLLCTQYTKHVLCEKPLGVNRHQVMDMTTAAKENGVFLMEALWTAFLPAIKEVKHEIEKGIIGDVRHIRADFGFKAVYNPESRLFNPSLAGGSLLDIGIYPIFIAMWLLGMPVEVEASIHKALTGVDDECTMLLTFEEGRTASLHCTVSCDTATTCEITGTEGSIVIPFRFHEQERFTVLRKGVEDAVYQTGITGKGYFHEIEHVHKCLSLGLTESPVMSHGFSLSLIEVMDTIRKKAGIVYPFE
jgi:predicted dehydrogenase